MTLAQLKAVCAAYHKKAVGDLTVNGVDLFLIAANNARRNGEKLQNFEMARVTATLDIDGETGGALADAVIAGNGVAGDLSSNPAGATWTRQGSYIGGALYIHDVTPASFLYYNTIMATYVIADVLQTDALVVGSYSVLTPDSTNPVGNYLGYVDNVLDPGGDVAIVAASGLVFSGIKEVQNIQRVSGDGTLEPLDFAPSEVAIERTRQEQEFDDNYLFENRYPSDARLLFRPGSGTILQRNESLYIYPKVTLEGDPLSVVLEGYGWLSDYTAADLNAATPKDFFLSYGANYLQWAVIVDLNMYFKTFVSRSEGNLAAPTELRDEAWRDFVLWDAYKVNNNLTRSR